MNDVKENEQDESIEIRGNFIRLGSEWVSIDSIDSIYDTKDGGVWVHGRGSSGGCSIKNVTAEYIIKLLQENKE